MQMTAAGREQLGNLGVAALHVAHGGSAHEVEDPGLAAVDHQVRAGNQHGPGDTEVQVGGVLGGVIVRSEPVLQDDSIQVVQLEYALPEVGYTVVAAVAYCVV